VNDLDLLMKIDRKISLLDFIGIQQELEDKLGLKVDLVEYSVIHCHKLPKHMFL